MKRECTRRLGTGSSSCEVLREGVLKISHLIRVGQRPLVVSGEAEMGVKRFEGPQPVH